MSEPIFVYNYCADESEELKEIKSRYLPKKETKLEELRRLDSTVQNSGIAESLAVGIISCLIFGVGMCCALGSIPGGMLLGVPAGIIGTVGMLLAYPVSRRLRKRAEQKYSVRILELLSELEK